MSVTRTQGRAAGFTLTELIIAVAVLGILTAIAYPSYQEFVRKSRRADAKLALLDLGNRLEQRYADTNTYATATIATDPATDVLSNADTPEGYYTLSISAATATTYTITATRKAGGPQASDTKCGNFTFTHNEVRGVTGSASVADCW